MTPAVQHAPLISPEVYLEGELKSECKHEYLGGVVYAMAGGTECHAALAANILGTLYAQLRGRHCRPFGSDMLVRVQRGDDLRFYYPDVSIICRPAGPAARAQTEASVIFEVLSESTARTDTGEKRLAYLTIPTLEAYVLVDSTQREVTVWRRTAGTWTQEIFAQPTAMLSFHEADCALSVREIYEGTGL